MHLKDNFRLLNTIRSYTLQAFACSRTTLIEPDTTHITRCTWTRSPRIPEERGRCLYAHTAQNVQNYGLTHGTAGYYVTLISQYCRSQWWRRRRSAAECLLGSWVRIPPGAWMFVSCECLRCQVEVCETGRSLVQRSPTDCGVCLSVIK
jgi:hypothetical protein